MSPRIVLQRHLLPQEQLYLHLQVCAFYGDLGLPGAAEEGTQHARPHPHQEVKARPETVAVFGRLLATSRGGRTNATGKRTQGQLKMCGVPIPAHTSLQTSGDSCSWRWPDSVTQPPTNLHCCYLVSHGMERSIKALPARGHTRQKVAGPESTHDGLTPGPGSNHCPTRLSSHYLLN